VSHRRREMYIGHALFLAAFPHYYTDLDVTWGNGSVCPVVVHYWAVCNQCTGFVAMTT